MIQRFVKKYLSIVFVIATLLSVLHHHNDLKQHSDCQICTVQSNITNADTPIQPLYITQLDLHQESVLGTYFTPYYIKTTSTLHPRAPPFFS